MQENTELQPDGSESEVGKLAGVIADAAGFSTAIITVACLTGVSGLVVAVRMRETLPRAAPLL